MPTQLLRVLLYCPLLAVLSFHTEMSRIKNFHHISFTLLTVWAQRCKGGTKEAGPSSKEGKGLFISAAMHVMNYYFKYTHKGFKFPISIQIFKTFVSSLKDHFQLAVQRLHSTAIGLCRVFSCNFTLDKNM